MKKNNTNFKYALALSCAMTLAALAPQTSVQAALSSSVAMPIVYTQSIDNLQYPATSQFTTFAGGSGTGKIVITKPTIIKAYMSWDDSTTTNPTVWFSHDANGIDVIGSQTTLTKTKNYQEILLDPGTYYFNYSLTAVSNDASATTTVGACIVGQIANSTETVYVSSKNNANTIKFNSVATGFLSETAPIDYYKFTLTEKSIVNINFNFQDLKDMNLGSAYCVLKNSMDGIISKQFFNATNADSNVITAVLDPGTYYINMTGATTVTSLKVSKTPYVVTSSLSTTNYTKGNVKITLKIPYDYSELLVTKGSVRKSLLTDYSTWYTYGSDTTFALPSNSYTVSANGTYTFRIYDYLGNYSMHSVKVTNIDKTAPTVSGVANKKTYTAPVTIKFSDSLSGVKSAKLNGTSIKSGYKVSKKGTYKLVVTDNVGNVKTVSFTIK